MRRDASCCKPPFPFLGEEKMAADVQGDHSGSSQCPVDIKIKVAFQYKPFILKCNFLVHVNGRLGTT